MVSHREYRLVRVGKEDLVQSPNHLVKNYLIHHETDVEARSAERNHADVDVFEGRENLSGYAVGVANSFADDAHDRLPVAAADLRDLLLFDLRMMSSRRPGLSTVKER